MNTPDKKEKRNKKNRAPLAAALVAGAAGFIGITHGVKKVVDALTSPTPIEVSSAAAETETPDAKSIDDPNSGEKTLEKTAISPASKKRIIPSKEIKEPPPELTEDQQLGQEALRGDPYAAGKIGSEIFDAEENGQPIDAEKKYGLTKIQSKSILSAYIINMAKSLSTSDYDKHHQLLRGLMRQGISEDPYNSLFLQLTDLSVGEVNAMAQSSVDFFKSNNNHLNVTIEMYIKVVRKAYLNN